MKSSREMEKSLSKIGKISLFVGGALGSLVCWVQPAQGRDGAGRSLLTQATLLFCELVNWEAISVTATGSMLWDVHCISSSPSYLAASSCNGLAAAGMWLRIFFGDVSWDRSHTEACAQKSQSNSFLGDGGSCGLADLSGKLGGQCIGVVLSSEILPWRAQLFFVDLRMSKWINWLGS